MTRIMPNSDPRAQDRRDTVPGSISLISYNLWQGRAQRELSALVESNEPDLLCLQEAAPESLPARLGGLRMAALTRTNHYRVALYARDDRFEIVKGTSFRLFRSVHDRLLGYTGERLAAALLRDRETGRELVVGSLHATPLTDPNISRLRQISDAHRRLRSISRGAPVVMAGDFNFPILSSTLRLHAAMQGFRLARSRTSTYQSHSHSHLHGNFDLATTQGLEVSDIVTLPQNASDHKPVRLTFTYSRQR